jgi:hypothetical protein
MPHPPVLEIRLNISASPGQQPSNRVIVYKLNQDHEFVRSTLFAYRPDTGCRIVTSGAIKTPDDRVLPLWSDVEIDVCPKDGEAESGKKKSTRRINLQGYAHAVLSFRFSNRGTTVTCFDFEIRKKIYQLEELVAYCKEEKLRAEAIQAKKVKEEKRYVKKMHLQLMTRILKRRKFYSELSESTARLETWLHQRSEQKTGEGVKTDEEEDEEIPSDVMEALDRADNNEIALFEDLAEEHCD